MSFITAVPTRAAQTVFMLDAGHGGKDPGATHNGRNEKDDNLRITLAVGERLARSGVKVLYTRTDDTFLELSDRAAKANSADADYFISFHRNSASTVAQGVEVYYYSGLSAQSTAARLAAPVQTALVSCGFRDRGVKQANFAVLRKTSMPAILIELGFINNDSENAKLDAEHNGIADAIASALLSFVGKTLIPVTTVPPTTEPPTTEPPTTEPTATEPTATTTTPQITKPQTTVPQTTKPPMTTPEASEQHSTIPHTTHPDVTDPPSLGDGTTASDTESGIDPVTDSETSDAVSEKSAEHQYRSLRYAVLAMIIIAVVICAAIIMTKRR